MIARAGRAPTQRQLRVGEELRHILARVIERGDFHDPVLVSHPLTVTEVRVSPDLRNATVFVVPLGGADVELVVGALNRAAAHFRHKIAPEVHLRVLPRLNFKYDESFDTASQIEGLLADPRVARDLRPDDDTDDGIDD